MNFHLKKQTLIYIFKFDFFGFNLNTCQGIKRRKSLLKGFPCNGNPVLCLHILMAFSDDSLLVPENYLVNPLHVVSQLLQVFDVTITNFADDESTLALAVRLSGLQGLRRLRCWWLWAGSWMSGDTSATGKRSDWNTGLTSARVVVSLTYALKKMMKFQNISFHKVLTGNAWKHGKTSGCSVTQIR